MLVTGGFAYAPSDPERAEALFRRAVSVARAGDSPTEVEEVYEQYLEFLADQPGREADPQAALRELADWKRSRGWLTAVGEPALTTAPITKAVKVGRNEPCPCGSGRKFKRCCGA